MLFGDESEKDDEWSIWHIWGKCACRDSVGKPEGRRLLGGYRKTWEVILKWILKNWDGGHGLD
jgi:hypothetical protein